MSTGRPHHYGHLLQVKKESLQHLTLYTSFHDLINVYSRRSEADRQPQGTKFWCQQKPLVTSVICYKFQKNLFEVWFYTIFFMILYMYLARGRDWQLLGDKILMPTGLSCHFGHLLQVSTKSLWSLILYNFFHDFIHVYSPGAGADNPQGTKFWCQQKYLVNSFICCQFKKKSLWSLILYNFFHDLIHVYSPRAGADSPQGTKFWCQQKGLITLPICCKFPRNLFEVWFYTIFFMI